MRHHLLLSWITVTALTGCVIEERKFDSALAKAHDKANANDETEQPKPDAAVDGDSPECQKYCDRALANCKDEYKVYASMDTCLGVCRLLPLEPKANEDAKKSNTVACRSEQARLAGNTGEPEVHCPAAGPGGSASGRGEGCGNNCESYCMLQPQLCGDGDELVLEQAECEERCAVLPDRGAFDVKADHDANNVQCRLVHLSSAALGATAAEDHCWHTSLTPREGSPCGLSTLQPPSCEEYCDVVNRACVEGDAVYDDEEQCLAACNLFSVGTGADRSQDSLGCRLYHSYASVESPELHCPHAGPAGDGHCGKNNCDTYCDMAKAACSDAFDAAYPSIEECESQCLADLSGGAKDSDYVAAKAHSGDTVQCRIYHATLAPSDAAACEAVFGGAPCNE